MPLTKEQLLHPRYRVIADYPMATYKKDSIVPFSNNLARIVDTGQCLVSVNEDELKKYPHLFAPVHWTENRKKGEFPEYVLYDKTCVPAKVLSVRCDEAGMVTEIETDAESGEYYRADIWDFPATEEEYEQSKQHS